MNYLVFFIVTLDRTIYSYMGGGSLTTEPPMLHHHVTRSPERKTSKENVLSIKNHNRCFSYKI